MNPFTHYNPVRVIFGCETSSRIGELAKEQGKKIILVSYEPPTSIADTLREAEESLREAGSDFITFYRIKRNPVLSDVVEAVGICLEKEIELIIAVGGGSVIDSAKVIAAGVFVEDDLWNVFTTRQNGRISADIKRALPVIAVPTVSATSSEMNSGAVITNDALMEKAYVFNDALYPQTAIIDPVLMAAVPGEQVVCGAMDALSHMIEPYFNSCDESPVQDSQQEANVRIIMDLTERVLKEPDNLELRGHLHWAVTLAHNGWLKTGVTYSPPLHHIGHVLSARFDMKHGATLSVLIPAWMRLVYEKRTARFSGFFSSVFNMKNPGTDSDEQVAGGIDLFQSFMDRVGAPVSISACLNRELSDIEIEEIADEVEKTSFNSDGMLSGNPCLTKSDVKRILQAAR